MSFRLERIGTFVEPNPENDWERGGTFNPSLLQDPEREEIIFTYRAVPVSGYNKGEFKPGVYLSSVGYGILAVNKETHKIDVKRSPTPLLVPDQPYERGMGCEDARLTKIGDTYTLPYTAVGLDEVEKVVVRMGLATSKDLRKWEKHGLIGPDEPTKAATIFEHDNGKVGMYFTIWPDSPKSSVMYTEFDTLDELLHPAEGYWNNLLDRSDEHIVFRPPKGAWRGAEIGAPPIPRDEGLLLIYCPPNMGDSDKWNIGAALLDKNDPTHVLAQTEQPLLEAETEEEVNAPICKKCVFPMGAVVVGETLLVAHGKGDTHAGLAKGNVNELMEELFRNK